MNGDYESKNKRIYINTADCWMTQFPIGVQANNSKTTRHVYWKWIPKQIYDQLWKLSYLFLECGSQASKTKGQNDTYVGGLS